MPSSAPAVPGCLRHAEVRRRPAVGRARLPDLRRLLEDMAAMMMEDFASHTASFNNIRDVRMRDYVRTNSTNCNLFSEWGDAASGDLNKSHKAARPARPGEALRLCSLYRRTAPAP
ncbi:M30 family zinc metallopeptidase [Cupriavidus necator]